VNILMMTNTFTPHVGGVARSVEAFTREYRRLGHRVVVVAPEFPNLPRRERDVIRVPAIQQFNGSDFSVIYPFSSGFMDQVDDFKPDIIHAHHPFLLGNWAVRLASERKLPLVFTHHTMYEQYTHYVPGDSPRLKQFAIKLDIGFCNLCNAVIAPSESVAAILRERGVATAIEVIPTGVYTDRFGTGDGAAFRAMRRIPRDAFVVGHLGRLAPEKNLPFLAEAVIEFLQREPRAVFLLVGSGPSLAPIKAAFKQAKLTKRLFSVKQARNQALVDAYHAMDVFAFASLSETQGMVLTEAMAAGLPVVAVDAPGAREVLRDGENGILLPTPDGAQFTAALARLAALPHREFRAYQTAARRTAREFSMDRTARKALALYKQLLQNTSVTGLRDDSIWTSAAEWFRTEWNLLRNVAEAATAAFTAEEKPVEHIAHEAQTAAPDAEKAVTP
jgi:glycosyltransferase involved in cell wall biosynthesis